MERPRSTSIAMENNTIELLAASEVLSKAAPQKMSVWKTEPEHERYVLYFAPELIEFIRQKQKYTTYRLGGRYDYLKVGDRVAIRENNRSEGVAKATIPGKRWSAFRDLPLETDGHEAYRNRQEARRVLSGYYSWLGREILDDDQFLVIDFRLEEPIS